MRILLNVIAALCLCAAFATADVYPLVTDPVTDKPLPEKPIVYDHQGRELRFADEASLDAFKKDPAPVLKKVDAKIIEQQLKNYPLNKCLVSGGALGGMGEPANIVVQNRLIRLCCAGCKEDAVKDFAANKKQLDTAVIEQQAARYPLKTCVVSGDDLGDSAVSYVHGTTLVRVCCDECVKAIEKNPQKYLDKLTAK